MTIPASMVVEKSLTKKNHSLKYCRKENWTNKKRRLVLNPTIQQGVTSLHTKYDYSGFHGCGEIFDEKFRKRGQTDGRTEGRTDVNQYTPTFSKRGFSYADVPFSHMGLAQVCPFNCLKTNKK